MELVGTTGPKEVPMTITLDNLADSLQTLFTTTADRPPRTQA